jgi:hypothetical protein
MRKDMPYVICARTAGQAREWALEHNIPRRRTVYASRADYLEGMSNFAVVELPGFWNRKDAADIRAAIARDQAKTG